MNVTRNVLILLAAALLVSPLASASNPETRGYTCLFGYDATALTNVCYLLVIPALPSVEPGETTILTPCVIGGFPCGDHPSTTVPYTVAGLGPYLSLIMDSCVYSIDTPEPDVHLTLPCKPQADAYVCTALFLEPLVARCTP